MCRISDTPFTTKGERTRGKIIEVASELLLQDGVARTTIEDVCTAAGVGRSQVYHYFDDKNDLVRAVIERQAAIVFAGQEPLLAELQGWGDWVVWRDFVIDTQQRAGCVGGCPLGSLASELADEDELTREILAASFQRWEGIFRRAIGRMKCNGLLRSGADVDDLSTTLLAALQGGLLLSQVWRNVAPLKASLDGAIAYLRTFSA